MDGKHVNHPFMKKYILSFSLFFIIFVTSAFFLFNFNLQRESVANHQEIMLAQPPPLPEQRMEYTIVQYEEWMNKFFENIAQLRYKEKEILTHKTELFRIHEHNKQTTAYKELFDQCQSIEPPSLYRDFHKAFMDEAWWAMLMHQHYLSHYPTFKECHFEKTKKHYTWLRILEMDHPKMLYRWLLHERSAYQPNIQDR